MINEKKKIKVYLQYPWKFPDSPYYKYLLQDSPEGIEYLNATKQKGVITNRKKFLFSNKLKKFLKDSFNTLAPSYPNAHQTPKRDYDLIHCAHCLSKNKDKPWVADIEFIMQLWVSSRGLKNKNPVREILKRNNCKKILPWMKWVEKNLLREFPEIKKKIEVVYPAIPMPKVKRKKHPGINLLFTARYFYDKGGLHALESIDVLTKRYDNVNGIIVSEIPKDIMKKYANNKKIKFFGLMPQKKLFEEIMPISDILVYPGYSDSFGFMFLEAMSFGIPTITVYNRGRDEVIRNKETGFVIPSPKNKNVYTLGFLKGGPEKEEMVKELIKKTSIIIDNKKIRGKMARKCIEEIKNGRFSINKRNQKLKKIYNEALK